MEPITCMQRFLREMPSSRQENTLETNNANKSRKNHWNMSSTEINMHRGRSLGFTSIPKNHRQARHMKSIEKFHENCHNKKLLSNNEHTQCQVSDVGETSLIKSCNCIVNNECKWKKNSSRSFDEQSTFTSLMSVCQVNFNRILNCHRRNDTLTHLWQACIIIFISLICVSSEDQCALGLKTPGRTYPAGDIVLEYGNPLRIFCILNKTYVDAEYPGANASDLVFFRSNEEMEPENIKIINETTIEMYLENPPPSKNMYYCRLRLNESYSKEYEPVCLNNVAVGFQPQEPKNFGCVSHNWENMICTWEPVENFVETRFTLVFKLPGRAGGRMPYPCPSEKDSQRIHPPNSCLWDTSTNPIYRQPYEFYTLILSAENTLGNNNFTYKFHHFAHVIPAKPVNLTVVNKTSESAFLHWSVPFPMQNFPPGLFHRIAYRYQGDQQKNWQIIDIINMQRGFEKFYNLSSLEFANTVYDVRVFMKSSYANGENHWSDFSDVTFRTLSKLPGQSPRTDIGSFEITENSASRDVYLYWQTIPSYLENGDNLTYQVSYVEENGRKLLLTPNETTRTYAKFKGISFNNNYRFEVIVTNVVGANPTKAQIIVPSRHNMPSEPLAFTKIAFDKGLYELSWKEPASKIEIKNYTIFWCENDRDRPYQCTGYLDWVHVPRTTTIYNMTVPDPLKVYQFAISANTELESSGMVWASCTVIHNIGVGKMKSVWINRIGSDFIEVGWKLDCSDRIGIVEGFKIYYCPIVNPHNTTCKEPEQNTTVKYEPHLIHGTANGLKPYSIYKISIAVMTKNGDGVTSDPLFNTTLEAAPSTPPQNITITNVTNTTMIVSWKPPLAMNGVLRYYEVHYSGNIQRVDESTHVVLKDLLAYKNYSISMTACTVACSKRSPPIYRLTDIGLPGKLSREPKVQFSNKTQVLLKWFKPAHPGGKLDYYQICSGNETIENSTKMESFITIDDCTGEGRGILYVFRVRAINIDTQGNHLYGPWSDPGEGNCYSGNPSPGVTTFLWIIGVLTGAAVLICLTYSSKRMWIKCKAMQDVEVKLPPGLQREKLLQKVGEQHIRQSSADSSGCSSCQESVTSSLTSDSHVSTDSGTEIDPVVSPNKLLEPPAAWESSSLRQRNVASAKPGGITDGTRWESYVKIPKVGEISLDDTLSLARSTPNLNDSSGYMIPQQAWSSTGYISMPSSEELSDNPSPIPKEITNLPGYSVVSVMPKSTRLNIENNPELKSELLKSQCEAKPNVPYVSLASLEQKPTGKKRNDGINTLNDLAFIESSKMTNVESFSPITALDSTISKPYVQTGMMDSMNKVTFTPTVDSMKEDPTKTFASKFLNQPRTMQQTLTDSKPYVTVSAIPQMTKTSKKGLVVDDTKHQLTLGASEGDTTVAPYVLAATIFPTHQQKDVVESSSVPTTDVSDHETTLSPISWESSDIEETFEDKKKINVLGKNSSGYVAVADLPKSGDVENKATSSYVQHKRLEKPSNAPSGDEKYSKVGIVPPTMQ